MKIGTRSAKMKKLLAVAALVACGAAGSASAATNLISDGDFSSRNLKGGYTIQNAIGSWVSRNGAGVEIGASGWYGLPSINAGGQNLEVNGKGFGDVYQNVNLTAGQRYVLTFLYGGRPGGGEQKLNVYAGNDLLTATPLTGSYGSWTSQSFSFIAKGGLTPIEFKSIATSGRASYGNAIANVSLSAVPEPASWGLMITGFGMVGGLLRRRKAAVRLAA
ncbi:PEPxxWA-CTERM sorting domain-containing protein [Sphingomonas elodea]|uniref:PEPxxWA-CTERM sorting domain-containing protein n=1 Tax=Sphingomonas elodea TaxID=179878 RepID=UPI0002631030|nr:PEPxxWA-CTERM sorting domain-containing protein [Sphingomonas elodea]